MSPRGHLRALAAAVLVLLVGTGSVRGFCPMGTARPPSPNTASVAPAADAHKCCKKGISSKAPSCCHADVARDTVATVGKTTLAVPAPSMMPGTVTDPQLEAYSSLVRAASHRAVPQHSPPPTVLRI
jgi:hypothetical protein